MDNKFVISNLETLGAKYVPEPVSDGMFNVEEFRKSISAPRLAKVLQFPAPAVEVSPAQVVEMEETPFQSIMRGVMLGGE
jgi:hypothetical protein